MPLAPPASTWAAALRRAAGALCGCFAARKAVEEELDKRIYHVSREYKISILPITPNFDIDNLYPLTDHVELWNTFVVGNDKTYILASVNDPHITIPRLGDLPNNQGKNTLPQELFVVFDTLWTKTLQGKQLQFYMVWNSKLYFMNTYPFFNGKGKVIGAILFMRAFETMPETRFTTLEGYLVPVRHSSDTPGVAAGACGAPPATQKESRSHSHGAGSAPAAATAAAQAPTHAPGAASAAPVAFGAQALPTQLAAQLARMAFAAQGEQ